MAVEIELKAHLDDPDPVRRRLDLAGTFIRSYVKNDSYWTAGEKDMPADLRVRRESGPSGEDFRDTALVTWKTRRMRDDIEVNDEREFRVTDPDIFEDLLGRLGLHPDIRKEKTGQAWTVAPEACREGAAPVLAELSLVTGLGWFIELEILAETGDEQTVAESRRRLRSLLAELGVPPERIERRPYTAMLRDRNLRARNAAGPGFTSLNSV